jgi:hypothetical protein
MKDQEERRHLSGFIRTKDAPVGMWCIDEKPDMWMRSSEGILGVEHTRLVRGEPRAGETNKRKAVRLAQRIFESAGGPVLHLWVSFRTKHIPKGETEEIARAIAEVVERNIPKPGERNLLQMWRLAPDVRPPKVLEIDIDRWPEAADSFWAVSLGGVVPRLTSDEVQKAIDAKESKVEAYRKRCDILWLLVALDGFSPSGWWDILKGVVDAQYSSSFDRVILYDHFGRESFVLDERSMSRGNTT